MLASLIAQDGSASYMPHGMCYLWQEDLVWLHVISDSLTTLAYWAIPPVLVYLALKARDQIPSSAPYAQKRLPYDWMFVAFGVFIVACGATHAMGIWTIWEPRYWLEGGVKAVTAVASVATAVALPPLVPRVLELIREARESEYRRVELEEAHQEQEELLVRLREANTVKTRFFANVSHDLRTPLSLILGPVEEILEEEGVGAEVADRLEVVRRNARTLEGRVEDLLTVARMEAGPLEPNLRPTDLAPLVRDVADHFAARALGRGVEYRVEVPGSLVLRVDPDLLERAVLNLLSNAFEFTPDGGTLRCELTVADDGGAILTVADSGPGVPEDEREGLFDRFQQGSERPAHRTSGTGLGLAIVRDVAEAHGGAVELDDAPEGGARFTLRLPVLDEELGSTDGAAEEETEGGGEPEPEGRQQPEPEVGVGGPELEERPADSDRATVLVVEDDADMAEYLGRVLSTEHRVRVARDGQEGLRRAREFRPDLIVTDMMMPEMNGRELISALRRSPDLADVPVLVLTARADEELSERMLRGGAQDYVLKPVRKGELLARIQNLLDLTRSRQLLQREFSSEATDLQQLAREASHRKRALERTVQEKKLLLRELHHRVKGNLQTVNSLLQLQLRNVEDQVARRPLEESRGRVEAMSLLHERLYSSGALDRVEMSGYLRRLVSAILRTRGAESRIRTTLVLEDLEVPVESAVACGLVVHELVTNAIRHGFPPDAEGTVEVSLTRSADRAVLSVNDDGRGMEADEPPPPEGLGLELVRSLVGQLEGRLRIQNGDGTRVRVEFPLEEGES